jgi:hypothetical protein
MSAGCNHRLRKLRIGFRINEQDRKKQVPTCFPAGKPSTAAGSQRNPAKIRSMRPLRGRRKNCRPRPASIYFGTCGVIISTSEFSSSCAHDWSLSNPLKSPYDLRWEDDPGTLAHLRMRSGTFERSRSDRRHGECRPSLRYWRGSSPGKGGVQFLRSARCDGKRLRIAFFRLRHDSLSQMLGPQERNTECGGVGEQSFTRVGACLNSCIFRGSGCRWFANKSRSRWAW